jgi:hypothetical protein
MAGCPSTSRSRDSQKAIYSIESMPEADSDKEMRQMNMRNFFSRGLATGLVAAVLVSACDFEVTNPGPVQDQNLDAKSTFQGLVNGSKRSVMNGFGRFALLGGVIVGDLTASGHTGSSGVRPEEEVARLSDEYAGRGDWNDLHNGRWIAEEALRRFAASPDVTVSTYGLAAEAHFWAGIASRTLGENVCTTVFDGGSTMPKEAYFTDAEHGAIAHFSAAQTIANAAGMTDLATAAVGARAAAKLFIGDSGAGSDAAAVPFDFGYATQYTGFSGSERWYLSNSVMSLAFQSLSLWGTPMAEHFLTTGDSRTAFGYDNGTLEIPSGKSAAVRGQTHPDRVTWTKLIPMYYPLKLYAPRSTGLEGGILREIRIFEPDIAHTKTKQFNLVDGREMDLVEAETQLIAGNLAAAMVLINNVRTASAIYPWDLSSVMDLALHKDEAGQSLPNTGDYALSTPGDFSAGGMMAAVTATTLAEGWAALKYERLIELAHEGRRFGDRWRWRKNNTPGTIHNLEYIADVLVGRYGVPKDPLNLCFPLPKSENDANANIPADFKDWVTG